MDRWGFLRTAVEPTELFLERHRFVGPPIPWNSLAMADLLAYLLAHRTGEPVTVGGPPAVQEASR
jgi:hypothetical protein